MHLFIFDKDGNRISKRRSKVLMTITEMAMTLYILWMIIDITIKIINMK